MKKLKKNILLIFIVITNGYSQLNVEYSIYPNIIEDNNTKMDLIFEEINKQTKNIVFELLIKDTISKFSFKENLDTDELIISRSFAQNVIIQGDYYTNLKNNTTIQDIIEVGFFHRNSDIKWKLLSETKFINDFKCYKAITSKQIINANGVFNFEIVAWFCPSIPYSFGPKEFNGLPGLILELKDTHYTFIANKITTIGLEQIKISEPKCKIFSKEAYSEKLKENSILNKK